MSVYEGVPSPMAYSAMVLNNWIQRKRAQRVSVATDSAPMRTRLLVSFIRITLHIVGFSAFTNAMFHANIIVGWCAIAVSCFIFSWLFTGSSDSEPADAGQNRR